MMSVLLTTREKEILAAAKAFGISCLAPNAARWEEDRRLAPEAVDMIREHGFFGIDCPPELGGKGYSYLETALTYEGLGYGDGGMAFFIQLHNNITFEIATMFPITNAVRAKVPEMTGGRRLTCFSLTERDAGTDPSRSTTYAELREDGYHVFGEKAWASNHLDADYFNVIVKDSTPKGMIMLLVERGMPGFVIREDKRRVGGNAMSCGTLYFDDVVVPRENLLSADGFRDALRSIDIARTYVPATAVGVAQRALDITAARLAARETFGWPILKSTAVQWKLADLTAKVEAARWLCYHVASCQDAGEHISVKAAMNKLIGPDVCLEVALECAQLFGAEGCNWNSEITRCVNMARVMKIVDGTSEVQRMVIARAIEKQAFAGIAG